jgi:hypothetical protein
VAILAIASLGAALICYAYWPGIMIDDARWQYQQAVDNAYEDWHPPIMAWVWRQLIALSPGPAPMLTLQVLLYWIGFVLIASAAYRRGHSRLALALAATGFLPAPLALMGSVTKDALMAGALLMATGMLLWRPLVRSALARAALSGGVMAALFFAAALRFNAFFACIPLALVALPDRLTCTKPRMLLSAVAAAGAFLMTAPVIAGLLHAEDTDVQLSLIIFDIGGITEHTGLSQFPDMHVPNAVAVNHRCYDPYGWDSYSDWATKPCPLGFDAVQARIDDDDLNPGNLWIRAIAAHPLAYLDHRLAHFNLSTWFIVPRGPDFTAWSQSVPNPWNFRIRESGLLTAISALANGAAVTPLGWPIFWISVALAAIVGGTIAGLPREPIAIALSGFLYGCGYFVVGVATGIRYYMWTFSGAAVAAILVGAELWRRRAMLKRRAVLVCAGIVVAPTTMAIAARVVLG